ncbi:hypothetical protein AAFF_G00289720 [Aldrovandia affinis]|uniref:Uncharacterized protein n=1 Tax=Aldrovandia affinis TaxID=143900 RepID=A0AAD7R9W9_9TELE|nr:hypothetical protein AAFF_G00289720 [Aldrovandia affinis]
MELVQRLIQETNYHLNQAQVEVDLAKQTTGILTSASTRSAQYAYTWWDWVYRGMKGLVAVSLAGLSKNTKPIKTQALSDPMQSLDT